MTITQLIAQKVGKLGENITVRRFARFKVGDPANSTRGYDLGIGERLIVLAWSSDS